jgi:hypothetical protein
MRSTLPDAQDPVAGNTADHHAAFGIAALAGVTDAGHNRASDTRTPRSARGSPARRARKRRRPPRAAGAARSLGHALSTRLEVAHRGVRPAKQTASGPARSCRVRNAMANEDSMSPATGRGPRASRLGAERPAATTDRVRQREQDPPPQPPRDPGRRRISRWPWHARLGAPSSNGRIPARRPRRSPATRQTTPEHPQRLQRGVVRVLRYGAPWLGS